MGLFGRRRDDTSQQRILDLEARLDALQTQTEQGSTAPATVVTPTPPTAPPRLLDADETEAAIADLRAHLGRIDEQLALLDRRITSVSTELANQLTELSGGLDTLERAAAGGVGEVDPDIIAGLREAQEKLAAEQARYQIAFRQDLATLAERLRR